MQQTRNARDLRPRNPESRSVRTVTIKTFADIEGEWTFTSHQPGGVETRYSMRYRIGMSDPALTLYDRSGRLAQMPVFVNITEQDAERPSFIATRGTIRVQRLIDGTVCGYEAETDFGDRSPVNGTSKRETAEALVSAVSESWLAEQRRLAHERFHVCPAEWCPACRVIAIKKGVDKSLR